MIEGKSIKFGTLFDSIQKFNVPKYQRSYAWSIHGNDQVGQWLRDIDLILYNNKDYFIGTTVGVIDERNPDEKYTIVDGQQRITTTYILFYLMNEIYESHNARDNYFNRYISNKLLSIDINGNQKFKLSLNTYDNKFFKKLLKGENPVPEIAHESHTRLLESYDTIKRYLEKKWDLDGVREFNKILKAFHTNFIFVKVDVNNYLDAYQLFESMNDKGLELSKSDLIKNYMFSVIDSIEDEEEKKDMEKEVEESWENIQINIAKAKYDFNDWLVYYWDGKYHEIRKNQIFTEFKNKINNNPEKLKEIIDDLEEYSATIDMFYNPDRHTELTSHPNFSKLKLLLKQLKSIGNKQCHIMIIPLMCYYDREELDLVLIPYLETIRNFLFTFSTVCSKQTNVLLSRFCDEAKELHNENNDLDRFKASIKEVEISKSEFTSSFYKFRSTNDISKMILKAIYPAPDGFEYKDSKIWLEHIVPTAWKKNEDWLNYFDEIVRIKNEGRPIHERLIVNDYVNMIKDFVGNHCLIHKDDNIKLSNKFYNFKRDKYKTSSINSTKNIATEYDKFSEIEINKRTETIMSKIIDKWNLFD